MSRLNINQNICQKVSKCKIVKHKASNINPNTQLKVLLKINNINRNTTMIISKETFSSKDITNLKLPVEVVLVIKTLTMMNTLNHKETTTNKTHTKMITTTSSTMAVVKTTVAIEKVTITMKWMTMAQRMKTLTTITSTMTTTMRWTLKVRIPRMPHLLVKQGLLLIKVNRIPTNRRQANIMKNSKHIARETNNLNMNRERITDKLNRKISILKEEVMLTEECKNTFKKKRTMLKNN